MGSKVRCLGCGAKNDATAHRCRVCTTIINMYPQDHQPGSAPPANPLDNVFDANALDRQMRPAKSALGEKGGALGARIAAASAAKSGTAPAAGPSTAPAPASPASPVSPAYGPTPATFTPEPARAPEPASFSSSPGFYDAPTPASVAPAPVPAASDPGYDAYETAGITFDAPAPVTAAPPLEYAAEAFDPAALFADKNGEGEFF